MLFRGPKIYVELEVAVETFEVSFAGLGLPCVGLHVHNLRMMGSFFIYLHTQTQTYIYIYVVEYRNTTEMVGAWGVACIYIYICAHTHTDTRILKEYPKLSVQEHC